MTADEALEIVEIVLNYQRLNNVQELVFRQSWEGRSYKEIAVSAEYEYDYVKDAGAKLWKILSEAFGEKVKKDNIESVIKRYLRRNKVNSQQNLTIEVNLSGANLSGANLNGARVVANFIETDSSKAVSPNNVMPDNNIETGRETLDGKQQIYHWNGLSFRSEAQVKIAEALDRTNILFIPNFKIRLTSTEGRENKQVDFLIFYQGKSGILEIDRPPSQQDEENFRECDIATRCDRDRIFQTHGISIIKYYNAIRCRAEPDQIVQDFLETLSQAED